MTKRALLSSALLAVLLAGPVAAGDEILDEAAMAARIDARIAARWRAQGTEPAPLTSDAEFFRRLSLDLNGRIPTITALTDFLDDDRPNKRAIWITKLLDGRDPDFPDGNYQEFADLYARYFASYWQGWLFARKQNVPPGSPLMKGWLETEIKKNRPYNEMVRELLTSRREFYSINQNKPETLASEVSRLFLGIKLECAECHDDRSGGDWSRAQFWEFAAFFNGLNNRNNNARPVTIKISGGSKTVQARFLDGDAPVIASSDLPDHVLAGWITRDDNPYFARAAVNRMWEYFFGLGLVDPIDVMGNADSPPSHPELLDELTRQFVAHRFDVKYLIRAITGSMTYQRSSILTAAGQDDPRLFARMGIRGMSPEQLLASLHVATGARLRPTDPNVYRQVPDDVTQFLTKFRNPHDRRVEMQTSILQALYMMNNKWIDNLINTREGSLDIVQNARAAVTTERRILDLYLVSVSRKPTAQELERLVPYVNSGGVAKDRKKALADVFWALLNSTEFTMNH